MDIKFPTGKMATFPRSTITPGRVGLIGISSDHEHVMKVEIASDTRKEFALRGEANIIKLLNDRNCQTCPELIHFTEVSGRELLRDFSEQLQYADVFDADKSYPVMVLQGFPPMMPVCTQDIAMAIIEQKNLGVWHGDITVENTLIDSTNNCIKFIDYDQAILLDEEKIQMGNAEYFDWLDQAAKDRF